MRGRTEATFFQSSSEFKFDLEVHLYMLVNNFQSSSEFKQNTVLYFSLSGPLPFNPLLSLSLLFLFFLIGFDNTFQSSSEFK